MKRIPVSYYKMILIALLTFPFLSGCDVEGNKEEKNMISLGGRQIEISIYEGYVENEESEPVIIMDMVTDAQFESLLYDPPWFILETDVKIGGSDVAVKILGITDDINATHGSFRGPASKKTVLNLQASEYTLKFYTETDSIYHDIIISDEMISVPYVETSVIETNEVMRKMWRYPQNSCAVKVTTSETKKWVAEAFIDSMVSKLNFQKHEFARTATFPVNYGNTPYHFLYQNDEAFDNLESYLETFTVETIIPNTDNPRDVQIEIVNWKNRRIKSGDSSQ